MNCQEVMELMQRDLDRDLSDSEHEAMTAHLQQCPDCAEMYSRLRQLSQELASLPKVVPPFSLVDSILPQLAEIDRQGEGLAATATAGVAPASVATIPVPIERPRRTRGAWSIAATGGIVAAGLLLALFINDMDGNNKMADDSDLLYNSAASTAAPQSRSKQEPLSAGQQNRASGDAPAIDAKSDGSAGSAIEKKLPIGGAVTEQSGGAVADTPNKDTAQPAEPQNQPRLETAKPAETVNPGTETEAAGRSGSHDTYITSGDSKKPETNADAGNGTPEIEPPRLGITANPYEGSGNHTTEPPTTDNNKGITGDKAQDKTESISSDSAKSKPDAMGFLAPNPELLSEDGLLVAVLDQANRHIVIRTADGKQTHMYTSPRWSEREQAQLLKWSGSSKLTYSITAEGGVTKTIEIDVAKQKETTVQKP